MCRPIHIIISSQMKQCFYLSFACYLSLHISSLSISTSGTMEDMRRNQLSELGCIVEATGRTDVFESLLWLRNSFHPWNEFRLRNEAKLYKRMLSFLSSFLSLSFSLSFIYSQQCHVSCHQLVCMCGKRVCYIHEKTRRESRNYCGGLTR